MSAKPWFAWYPADYRAKTSHLSYVENAAYRIIIVAAEHDEVFIDIDIENLAAVATEENIRDLHRCGVLYSSLVDSLAMFA